MSAMMQVMSTQRVLPVNTWTGTTTGLQLNLLNAPAAGTTWTDASGNGNNGTVRTSGSGSATYTIVNNGGLTLGSSNLTNMAMVSTGYNLSSAFTVEVVANITASGFWASLFGNDNYNSGTGYFGYWGSSTTFNLGSSSRTNSYTVTANAGVIRQFTMVYDNTPSVKLYINGTLQTATSTGYSLAPTASTTGLNFGSRHPNDGTANTPNDCATGTYYQMRVYNIALSQSQVTDNYNAIKSTYGI